MAEKMSKSTVGALKGRGYLWNEGTGENTFSARVITVNGRITAEKTRALAQAADMYGNGMVSFTTRQTVEIPGIPLEKIDEFEEFIGGYGLAVGGTGKKVRPIVSCKGEICSFGQIGTFSLSEKIHEAFYEGYRQYTLPYKFKIAVGGCPNNCVKPDLNDIGVVGACLREFNEDECHHCKKCGVVENCPINAAQMVNGKIEFADFCNRCGRCVNNCYFNAISGEKAYKVYIGGRWGKKTKIGQLVPIYFKTEDEVMAFIEKTLLFYIENGEKGERFEGTIERLGFDEVVNAIISDDSLLKRKEEILAAAE